MAKTNEQKAAEGISKAFNTLGLNTSFTASFAYNEMTPAQHEQFFDFMMHMMNLYANDSMAGHVSTARAERNLIAIEFKETVLDNAGYHFRF